jgi:hypothetical protein
MCGEALNRGPLGSLQSDSRGVTLEGAMALYNLENFELLWERRLDTKALMAWNDDTVVLSFRGTASFRNVLADIKVGRQHQAVTAGAMLERDVRLLQSPQHCTARRPILAAGVVCGAPSQARPVVGHHAALRSSGACPSCCCRPQSDFWLDCPQSSHIFR